MISNNAAQPPSVGLLATPALCDAEFFCDDTKEGITSGQLVPDLIHDVELSMLAEQQLGGKRLRELDDDSKTIILPWRIAEEHMPDATQAGMVAAPLLQRRVTE